MKAAHIKRDWPGAAVALICLALGIWILYETSHYSMLAAVFPRVVAGVMILASAAWGVLALKPVKAEARSGAGLWRPLAMIAVGAVWAALIPAIGFLAAGLVGFLGAMVVAKFYPWSMTTWLRNVAIGVLIVGGIYTLFAVALKVPI